MSDRDQLADLLRVFFRGERFAVDEAEPCADLILESDWIADHDAAVVVAARRDAETERDEAQRLYDKLQDAHQHVLQSHAFRTEKLAAAEAALASARRDALLEAADALAAYGKQQVVARWLRVRARAGVVGVGKTPAKLDAAMSFCSWCGNRHPTVNHAGCKANVDAGLHADGMDPNGPQPAPEHPWHQDR